MTGPFRAGPRDYIVPKKRDRDRDLENDIELLANGLILDDLPEEDSYDEESEA